MKNKQTFLTKGSFALLLFVILGYVVKFHPNYLKDFDSLIQITLRGDLPHTLTFFFSSVTSLINTPVIMTWVAVLAGFFLYKKWWSEAILLIGNLALTGLLVAFLKNIYQHSRPAIQHLVEEGGFSFPSGHALASTLIFGTLLIIVSQRIKSVQTKRILQSLMIVMIFIIMTSRVYLGVHYPTDVLGSFLLGLGILHVEFPYYDKLRFQWRFKGKQK
ncbi:phosphatase PAP2 family protein [Streptococcus constellatus]|uniref:PAP2 family protein n=1 Tax=Streptococcus constellatus subsp. constellatus SK53 TaxID=1095730 RepID=A0AAD2Y584_STRCV|nr:MULTISPECIES: phosphatase PAP2 family protein [Streptococcus]EID22610.1 PAP2 family protein [Streptococcus constellatus subsp. constellatus SK53]MDK6973035.1 phosphatase PAP2 family protein [Streptococcus constellatus]MDP1485250.1 phosphatase PAP2 family protein [Streptococcus constellatus]OFP94154.1 phosphatase [Streptococcus sp. HMSC067A03]QQT06375.1 phosphatase PAP2 family protein [Streptococcus constellatus]